MTGKRKHPPDFAASNADAAPVPRRRGPGRPFPPGKSGNPTGRPKSLLQVQQLARKYAAEAVETLATLMRTSRSSKVRVAAAQALLDRGYGKPPIAIAVAKLDRRKIPNFGMSFENGGPGQDVDVPDRWGEDIEVSPALPAPEPRRIAAPLPAVTPSPVGGAPLEPAAEPAERGPVVVDQETEMVIDSAEFEKAGRPAPSFELRRFEEPDEQALIEAQLQAGQRAREADAARRRAANEEQLERENARAREQQRIREERMRAEEWPE